MNIKKLFFVFLIIVFSCIFMILLKEFYQFDTYEKIYTLDSNSDVSGESMYLYDAIVTDDTITFYDNFGNSIIYVFNADKLENVFNVYNAKSEAEAKRIVSYYNNKIGNGEISKVSCNGTTVSVMMDINYFSEYQNYSKKEIEDILLQSDKKIEMED